MGIYDRLRGAWDVFKSKEDYSYIPIGPSSSSRPYIISAMYMREKSIVSSIYNAISLECSGVEIRHCRVDGEGLYVSESNSRLASALSWSPNEDQTPLALKQDIIETMFDDGVAAVVPIDTSANPILDPYFDIYTLRVGRIKAWFPDHVRVSLYNVRTGQREEIVVPKSYVAIIQNPFYSVMNEPNSTLKRLTAKLNLLDAVDEASSSGKLDIIIQLPYAIKNESRARQADMRRQALEEQLKGSMYGIAYTDATEKITQLNRPAENSLLGQIEFLTNMLYGQLGVNKNILDGTADEITMINFRNRTIKPILLAITQEFNRKFLGPASIRKNEKIMYFREPFTLATAATIADVGDKLTRNEILTANEVRAIVGIKPSTDPKADTLTNSNMPAEKR